MKEVFGKTWWGQEFLKSLTHIDNENRLPRGKSYATKGAVEKLEIKGNEIFALVKGSSLRPYKVGIMVPKFINTNLDVFIKLLSQNPAIIARLLNKELDPLVMGLAKEAKLQVFPRTWSDFYMRCSCPDFAVPCKHLAAVIYKFSQELDNDPFIIFKLHGIDLGNKFKKIGIQIKPDLVEYPGVYDLHIDPKVIAILPKENLNQPHKIDLSKIPNLHEPLLALLGDKPVFYSSSLNFKTIYSDQIGKIIKCCQGINSGKYSLSDFLPIKPKGIRFEPKSEAIILIQSNYKKEVKLNGEEISISDLIQALLEIPNDEISHYQSSTNEYFNIVQLAFVLISNGSIIPQIILLENDQLMVRWLPANLNPEIKNLIQEFEQNSYLMNFSLNFNGKNIPITKSPALNLLSVFISELISFLNQVEKADIYTELFFKIKVFRFHKPGENKISTSIQNWLKRYYLTEGDFKIQFLVLENEMDSFSIEIVVLMGELGNQKIIPLHEIFSNKSFKNSRFEILQMLSQLSSFIPWMDKVINEEGKLPIVLNESSFADFLFQVVPSIQMMNIPVLLPKSLSHILKPRVSIKVKKENANPTFFRLDQLLSFDWKIAIGEDLIDEKEFMKLVKKSNGLIRYKSSFIYVNQNEIEIIRNHFKTNQVLSTFTLLRSALTGEYAGAKISLSEELSQAIKELSEFPEITLPKGLKAKLRPYQHRGYSWLYRNAKIGFGSLLADDMGLGKTIQVITLLLKYKQEGHFKNAKALIIVPTGLLSNWQSELERFAPKLNYKTFHGSNRELKDKNQYDVLITTYGLIRNDVNELIKMPWHVVVIDEAQNIKNGLSEQSKAVKTIPANHFIALSGTPVENKLSELYYIMDYTNRGILGNFKDFTDNYINPIQKQNDEEVAQKLMQVNAPFIMRRLKSDKSIISDLPDKIEIDSYAQLELEQAALYKETLTEALKEINTIQESDHQSLFKRQGLVLQMILALKQICNHPTQFLKNGVNDPSLSGKMNVLFNKLETILESNEKVLIFTQFKEMGELICDFILQKFQEKPLFYHGSVSLKDRKSIVDSFQTNPAERMLVLTLKSAGTGLNLTGANHVIHYDLWWNPAVESQATDRAYRIGQNKNVMVHRFITKNTFEERINEMIQKKKELANLTVSTGENWLGNLSNQELTELFSLSNTQC